jgi:hypothetical protein
VALEVDVVVDVDVDVDIDAGEDMIVGLVKVEGVEIGDAEILLAEEVTEIKEEDFRVVELEVTKSVD